MPTITFDWKFFVTLLAGIAGVVVPVFLWQFDLSSRSLSTRLVTSVALQPEVGAAGEGLQVVLDGAKLESPYLSTLELTNDGSKPIAAADFEVPLELRVAADRKVVRARISSSQPASIPGSLVVGDQVVKLQPLLLNPKDSITFAIITAGGVPSFEPHARISGVSKVSYEVRTSEGSRKKGIGLLLVAVVSLAIYGFFLALFFWPNGTNVSLLLSFGTMFVCLFSMAESGLRAFAMLGIEDSRFNQLMVVLAALPLTAVFYYLHVSRSPRK
jgi:hypothetical protein